MNLHVLSGPDALKRVRSESFQSGWKALYDRCPWATACQHPDFLTPWYELYHATFMPVVIFEELQDGSLAGLLTLALRRPEMTLTGAGEYQGWLQAPGSDGGFIVQAMRQVRTVFPGVDIHLKYLPPDIPLDWIGDGRSLGGNVSLTTHARPIMRADPAAMARQRNKKNQRQNYNRLNRLGRIEFRKVVDDDDFIRVFGAMRDQYDFRQAALFHTMPFLKDPCKSMFYTELHKRGLLHTTVLSVGSEVAAAHIGLVSRNRAVHLGIITHNPALAAHSPGNLLLAMLGVHLAVEEVESLDLTPGGDAYKEHFATDHDSVFELTVYGGMGRRLRTQALLGVKRFAKTRLQKAGVRPAALLAAYENMKRFKSNELLAAFKTLGARSDCRPCDLRYCGQPRAAAAGQLLISRNRLQDVFKFDADGEPVGYCEFLGMVMKQMERSRQLYSLVLDDKLQIFCWVQFCHAEAGSAAGDSIVLSGLYVHSQLANDELIQCFLEQLLHELNADARVYYRGVLSSGLQALLQRCGFVDQTK